MNAQTIKEDQLRALYEPYKKCTQCPLGTLGRTNVVFGEGDPKASLMIIGEGPGQKEDELGRPFVGKSGALLSKALRAIGLNRSQVYISNIVKCRPPKNRTPVPAEMSVCKKLLLEKQIQIIKPKIICTLGAAALQGLSETPIKITQERGKIREIYNTLVLPTYHPAYILRNPSKLQDLIDDLHSATQHASTIL